MPETEWPGWQSVQVRNRFERAWVSGFEVADVPHDTGRPPISSCGSRWCRSTLALLPQRGARGTPTGAGRVRQAQP